MGVMNNDRGRVAFHSMGCTVIAFVWRADDGKAMGGCSCVKLDDRYEKGTWVEYQSMRGSKILKEVEPTLEEMLLYQEFHEQCPK